VPEEIVLGPYGGVDEGEVQCSHLPSLEGLWRHEGWRRPGTATSGNGPRRLVVFGSVGRHQGHQRQAVTASEDPSGTHSTAAQARGENATKARQRPTGSRQVKPGGTQVDCGVGRSAAGWTEEERDWPTQPPTNAVSRSDEGSQWLAAEPGAAAASGR
jgi:hypothetical protein